MGTAACRECMHGYMMSSDLPTELLGDRGDEVGAYNEKWRLAKR